MNRKKTNSNGIVYSTDPDFKLSSDEIKPAASMPPADQPLKVLLDKKQRAGKAVTLIDGFSGLPADLETLGKTIKTFCGTGGTVKDGQIIIQGDQREKVIQWLQKNGYKKAKKAG